jgi:hypothetical protein
VHEPTTTSHPPPRKPQPTLIVEAEVGVVEFAACGPQRRFESHVDVAHDREPMLGSGVVPQTMVASRNAGDQLRVHEDGAFTHYRGAVSGPRVLGGVVHKLPGDLRKALIANRTALDAWHDITPLARNEFICWVEDAKQDTTRQRRIRRTQEELEEGQRRPCCWPGCKHRERTGI